MEKILIIDDSHVQTTYLKSILEPEYEVMSASTAEDGFRTACEDDFSLILLDVVMPGMNGFTLLEKLQEDVATRHTPVILITGLSDTESEERGLRIGAVDYITKPFHPLLVKARVQTHIKLYSYRRKIEEQSMTDQLTGIANRRRHDRYSLIKWQEATRLQLPFSICMFDIDHFKLYNDTFGHPAGDKVIAGVAAAASKHLRRSTDFIARYGGEEFVAFMLGDQAEAAFNHLKTIRKAIEGLHIPHSPEAGDWVTVSIGGVTMVPQPDHAYDTYLKIADTMLYDAKRLGRNRVVWTNGKMQQWQER